MLENLFLLVYWYPVFLFSTTVHEAAHAWVAWRGGDPTAYHGGQVSLDPLPHIKREPIGMVVAPLLTGITMGWTMGWASAPYDPRWAERYPRRAAVMALAGPASNLALALLAFALLKVGLMAGWFVPPATISSEVLVSPAGAAAAGSAMDFVARLLSVALVLNVILTAFNLIPLPPLDGSGALPLVLPARAAEAVAEMRGTLSWIGLLVAWRVFPYVYRPLFWMVVNALHPGLYGRS